MTETALVICRNCRTLFGTDKYCTKDASFSEPLKCPSCHCFLDVLSVHSLGVLYDKVVITQIHSVVGEILYSVTLPSEGELESDRSRQRLFWHECISICKYSTEAVKRIGCNTFLNPKDAVAYVEEYIEEVDYDESCRVRKLLDEFTKDMGASAVEKFEKNLIDWHANLGGRWTINVVPHSEMNDVGESCCTMCNPRVE